MTAVLCYGDSNTWGYAASTQQRLGRWERWPGVVQRALGEDVHVIEEALNGRTTAFEVPFDPGRNGLASLPIALESHAPLDVVVIALGVNDLFVPGALSVHHAARGAITLVEVVAASDAGPGGESPEVLLLVPPPLGPLGVWDAESPHAELESRGFADAYRLVAEDAQVPLLDLGAFVTSSPVDGVHFEAEDHRVMGEAIAAALRDLMELR